MPPADSIEEKNKRTLTAKKLEAVRLRSAEKLSNVQQTEETADEENDLNVPFDSAQSGIDEEETTPMSSGLDEDGKTTGDIEHEKALAGRLDRQKALDEQSKSNQEEKVKPESKKLSDQSDQEKNKNRNIDNDAINRSQRDKEKQQKEWGKKSAFQKFKSARKMMQRPQIKQQSAMNKMAGMLKNIFRFKSKGFSCTGFIGTVYRLMLDYVGGFYVYTFLDSMIQEDNTDRLFTCNCCLNCLSQMLFYLSPILIALALMSAAGYLLNGLIDVNQILNFLK